MKQYRYLLSVVVMLCLLIARGDEPSAAESFNDDDIDHLRDPFSSVSLHASLPLRNNELATTSFYALRYMGRLYDSNRTVGIVKTAHAYFAVHSGQIIGSEQGEIMQVTAESLTIAASEKNNNEVTRKIVNIKAYKKNEN